MDLIATISKGYFTNIGTAIYYCIDLPEMLASKNVFPKIRTQGLDVKIVMDDFGPHVVVDNLVAEKSIDDLIPKLSIKD